MTTSFPHPGKLKEVDKCPAHTSPTSHCSGVETMAVQEGFDRKVALLKQPIEFLVLESFNDGGILPMEFGNLPTE